MSDEQIKMEEKDLKKIDSVQKEFDELTYELGKTELNIMQAREQLEKHQKEKEEIEEKMNELRKKYQSVSRELHKKYGGGYFDSEGKLIKRKKSK